MGFATAYTMAISEAEKHPLYRDDGHQGDDGTRAAGVMAIGDAAWDRLAA